MIVGGRPGTSAVRFFIQKIGKKLMKNRLKYDKGFMLIFCFIFLIYFGSDETNSENIPSNIETIKYHYGAKNKTCNFSDLLDELFNMARKYFFEKKMITRRYCLN